MNYRLLAYLSNELQGLWIDQDEEIIHLHIKTSTPIIKSIWSGAPLQLVIGQLTEKNILVLGMIIEDNADNPYVLAYPPREHSEIRGLNNLLSHNYKSIQLNFYDAHTLKVMDLVVNPSNFVDKEYVSSFESKNFNFTSGFKEGDNILEIFFNKVLANDEILKTQKIIKFPLSVIAKKAYLSCVHEPNNTKLTYDLSFSENGSEGYDQELFIYHSLRQIFNSNEAFHSPNIMEGSKQREFVDILVVEGEWILSIQSKASSLIEMGLKSHEKLCSMYKKKALQGIEQVKGIIPILKDDVIIKKDEVSTSINKKDNVYHLVIISDLVLDEDGANKVFNEIHNLYNAKDAKVLVMSIEGLVNFVKISRLNKKLFWINLENKFQFSFNNRTILIRDIDSSQEHNLPFIAPEQYISHLRGDS